MRSLLALLATVALGFTTVACGSASKIAGTATQTSPSATAAGVDAPRTPPGTAPSPAYTKADRDKDNDIGAPYDDTNNDSILDFAHPASAPDKRAITALLNRYYAAAAAGDGAKACTMLPPTLVKIIPEDYGQSPGPSYLRGGKTCSAVMALLFKHFRDQLAAELPLLKVTRVRLDRHHGLAVLNFGRMPERQISVAREGHTWRVEVLLDDELP